MNKTEFTNTNPPEEVETVKDPEEVTPVEPYELSQELHLKALQETIRPEFKALNKYPSIRLILRATELLTDRHSKEFTGMLKELMELFPEEVTPEEAPIPEFKEG